MQGLSLWSVAESPASWFEGLFASTPADQSPVSFQSVLAETEGGASARPLPDVVPVLEENRPMEFPCMRIASSGRDRPAALSSLFESLPELSADRDGITASESVLPAAFVAGPVALIQLIQRAETETVALVVQSETSQSGGGSPPVLVIQPESPAGPVSMPQETSVLEFSPVPSQVLLSETGIEEGPSKADLYIRGLWQSAFDLVVPPKSVGAGDAQQTPVTGLPPPRIAEGIVSTASGEVTVTLFRQPANEGIANVEPDLSLASVNPTSSMPEDAPAFPLSDAGESSWEATSLQVKVRLPIEEAVASGKAVRVSPQQQQSLEILLAQLGAEEVEWVSVADVKQWADRSGGVMPVIVGLDSETELAFFQAPADAPSPPQATPMPQPKAPVMVLRETLAAEPSPNAVEPRPVASDFGIASALLEDGKETVSNLAAQDASAEVAVRLVTAEQPQQPVRIWVAQPLETASGESQEVLSLKRPTIQQLPEVNRLLESLLGVPFESSPSEEIVTARFVAVEAISPKPGQNLAAVVQSPEQQVVPPAVNVLNDAPKTPVHQAFGDPVIGSLPSGAAKEVPAVGQGLLKEALFDLPPPASETMQNPVAADAEAFSQASGPKGVVAPPRAWLGETGPALVDDPVGVLMKAPEATAVSAPDFEPAWIASTEQPSNGSAERRLLGPNEVQAVSARSEPVPVQNLDGLSVESQSGTVRPLSSGQSEGPQSFVAREELLAHPVFSTTKAPVSHSALASSGEVILSEVSTAGAKEQPVAARGEPFRVESASARPVQTGAPAATIAPAVESMPAAVLQGSPAAVPLPWEPFQAVSSQPTETVFAEPALREEAVAPLPVEARGEVLSPVTVASQYSPAASAEPTTIAPAWEAFAETVQASRSRPPETILPMERMPLGEIAPSTGEPPVVEQLADAPRVQAQQVASPQAGQDVPRPIDAEWTNRQTAELSAPAPVAPAKPRVKGGGVSRVETGLPESAPDSAGIPAAVAKGNGTATPPVEGEASLPVSEPKPVFEQIVEQAKTALESNRGEMEIQLVPERLGRLRLQVLVENGQVTARIITERQDAHALLERSLPDLKLALGEQGLRVQEVKLTLAGHGQDLAAGSHGFGRERQGMAQQFQSTGESSSPSEEWSSPQDQQRRDSERWPELNLAGGGRIDYRV